MGEVVTAFATPLSDWRKGVLVVYDPSAFTRRLVADVLRAAGGERVETAADPVSALNTLRDRPRGALIADWRRGDGAGLDVLRDLRRSAGPERRAPAVMLSARAQLADVMAARDAGVNEYLLRPISPHALTQRVEAACTRPRAFIETESFTGPDRRRTRGAPVLAHKRRADIDAGLTSPLEAARAQADAMAFDMMRRGDLVAARVGRSLRRFLDGAREMTPKADEVVRLHRASLSRLSELHSAPEATREQVVVGLEQVVAKRRAA